MLAVPRGRARVVVVAEADGPRLLGITNWVGRAIEELHASAAGKLLLAELDDDAPTTWIRRVRPRRLTSRRSPGGGALLGRGRPGPRPRTGRRSTASPNPAWRPSRCPCGTPAAPSSAMLGFSGPSERLRPCGARRTAPEGRGRPSGDARAPAGITAAVGSLLLHEPCSGDARAGRPDRRAACRGGAARRGRSRRRSGASPASSRRAIRASCCGSCGGRPRRGRGTPTMPLTARRCAFGLLDLVTGKRARRFDGAALQVFT